MIATKEVDLNIIPVNNMFDPAFDYVVVMGLCSCTDETQRPTDPFLFIQVGRN